MSGRPRVTGRPRTRSRRRRVLLAVGLVLTLGVAFGLYWFQPWKLFVDHRVDEALPDVALRTAAPAQSTPAAGSAAPSAGSAAPSATPDPPTPASSSRPAARLLATGTLISHEHSTHGRVAVVRNPDGSRSLALVDLATSDGPDVHVWLTDAPVRRGERGWYVFDDGRHVDLGSLKGNLGNQLYRIPPDVDLATLTSVSIWCARFDVSFGAAQLHPAT